MIKVYQKIAIEFRKIALLRTSQRLAMTSPEILLNDGSIACTNSHE